MWLWHDSYLYFPVNNNNMRRITHDEAINYNELDTYDQFVCQKSHAFTLSPDPNDPKWEIVTYYSDPNGSSPFVDGFVSASLLFVIGPLAILGSISDGMGTGIDQLSLKSILDFFAAIAFAASLGWGVAASSIPVGIYQGAWTVVGFLLGNVLAQYQIDAMTIVGGLLLLSIGLRLLKIKEVAVGNLLPALAVAPIFVYVLHTFIG